MFCYPLQVTPHLSITRAPHALVISQERFSFLEFGEHAVVARGELQYAFSRFIPAADDEDEEGKMLMNRFKRLNLLSDLSEVNVGEIWLLRSDESEVGELRATVEFARDGSTVSVHNSAVAGLVDDVTEGGKVGSEVGVGVGNWDLEAVVVWGKGEVSDEVGSVLGLTVVRAGDGDIGGGSAGGVVEVTVGVLGLWEEDKDLNVGAIEDTIEGGEGVGAGPEDTADGDELGVVTVEGESAGGVDWRVTSIDGGDGTASLVDVLSLPFGGGGNSGEGGGDLHII